MLKKHIYNETDLIQGVALLLQRLTPGYREIALEDVFFSGA